jgi:peptidoglycan/LPS O-acetylase OafA/YrhL
MTGNEQPSPAPLLFLLGLLCAVGSLAAFVADLVTGHDIHRSLGINAVGVGILVTWAAYDTLVDPDAIVESRGGAAGTGVLLYGLYLVLAGAIVAVTSLVHGRLELAAWVGGLGVVLVVVGFLAFPSETLVEDAAASEEDK